MIEERSVMDTSPTSVNISTWHILAPICERDAFAEAALHVIKITFFASTEPFIIEYVLFAFALLTSLLDLFFWEKNSVIFDNKGALRKSFIMRFFNEITYLLLTLKVIDSGSYLIFSKVKT